MKGPWGVAELPGDRRGQGIPVQHGSSDDDVRVLDGRAGKASDEIAVVRAAALGARAAHQQHARPRPRVNREVEPAVHLGFLAEVARHGHEIVGRHAELRRADVEQPGQHIAAAAGEPRVGRRRDAVLIVVGCAHGAVLDGREVAEPGPPVSGFDRHARQDLLLHARGELPVVEAVAGQRVPVVGPAGDGASEVGIPHRAALAVPCRVRQVAIRHEVAVAVIPRPVDPGDERPDGRRGCAIEGAAVLRGQIVVEAGLQRGPPVPEDVDGEAGPRREVVPRRAGRLRGDDVAIGRKGARADDHLGILDAEEGVPQAAAHGEPVCGPAVLDEQSVIGVQVRLQQPRRRKQPYPVRHAVPEPEPHWRVDREGRVLDDDLSVHEAGFEGMGSRDVGCNRTPGENVIVAFSAGGRPAVRQAERLFLHLDQRHGTGRKVRIDLRPRHDPFQVQEVRLQQEPVGDGGRPLARGLPVRAAGGVVPDIGFGREPPSHLPRTVALVCRLVMEGELVRLVRLPRDPMREGANRVLVRHPAAQVGLVGPDVRIAGVLVEKHAGVVPRAGVPG